MHAVRCVPFSDVAMKAERMICLFILFFFCECRIHLVTFLHETSKDLKVGSRRIYKNISFHS